MLSEKTQNLIFALITGHSIQSKFNSIRPKDIWDEKHIVDFFMSFFDVDLMAQELQRKKGKMKVG